MSLAPGSRLGPYEILSPLGAGGMGEVYRARDPSLGREVAIKILPPALSTDPEHLARFEREARLLASLNHPGIATIHGIERTESGPFLVLEVVEGETLAERLAAGPLPAAEALEICRQMADALVAAHDRGVVHRDLKPSNVKITPQGRVKILDFGLAKSSPFLSGSGASVSPTLGAESATKSGMILGTPAYMSPEQARGKTVDKRTDIWSFGCLLYEALTGRRAFDGPTASDCLVAILEREPAWERLPARTPPPVRRLIQRCLEKDAERRLRDAGDARLEIEAGMAAASSGKDWGERAATKEPGTLASLWRPFASFFSRAGSRDSSVVIPQPRLAQITFDERVEEFPAWSPDGLQIAFARETVNVRRIFVRNLQTGEESALTEGRFDDLQPDWSPDGRTILFVRSRDEGRKLEPGDVFGQYDGADIWAFDFSTRRETKLIEKAANPSWSPDCKRIAFDGSWAGPRRLWVSDARGRNPQQATSDVSEAVAHVRPRWSPDGRHLVFQNIERTKFDIRVVNLESDRLTWVTNDHIQDICPVWSPSGRFLYFSSYRSGGLNVWRVPVGTDGSPAGSLHQLTTGAGQDIEAAISRDGRRLAFSILKQNADLWKLPVSPATGQPTGAPEKVVASSREDSRGAWSHDGGTIAFNSDRTGEMNIWIYRQDDGSTRRLTQGPGGDFQPRFSPDGSQIAFFSSRSGSADVWVADAESGRARRLTQGSSIDVNPIFSPDGARIAYMSDKSGRLEVWTMNADGSAPRQITQIGVMGHFLAWTPDGECVLFRCPSGKMGVWRIPAAGGDPVELPEVAGGSHMSLSPDGSRIIDVLAHKTLWVSPLRGGSPERVFEFEDPDVRIDYPLWSPDGRWVLFDRFRPQGGDIWMMENFE
jgi:Tol biopolymer transport system component/serine/threonine protein kinase